MSGGWTTGPWRVSHSDGFPGARVLSSDGTRPLICDVAGSAGRRELPDAHLIAAAPDLAEALEAFKNAARLPEGATRSKRITVPAAIYHQACAALAKAKGGQP